MTRYSIFLASAAILMATPAAAGTGWYLGLGAGWATADSIDGRLKPAGLNGSLDLDDSIRGSGAVGYKWENFRLEVEGAYSRHDADRISAFGLGSTSIGGDVGIGTVLANAAYDVPLGDRFGLTFGGGAGWGWVDSDIGDAGFRAHGSDSAFAWQLFGGFVWSASDDVDLDLTYRYTSVGDTEHGTNLLPGPQRADFDDTPVQSVMLGIRWYFQRPESGAPPPPPPPQAPPAPPRPPQVFIVFFDFDKSNLTAEAQQVVAQAVEAVKAGNTVHVLVTGHTDTVGSHVYNQALSERRAGAVKSEMIRLGVADDQIATVGRSFDEPMVQTGPGVREPQNRRAVIELGK
jgi:outer membrane protein OmpA-like peptidoglycan-associated protein